MNGRNARKRMLNQLKTNIIRNNKKVIRREINRRIAEMSFWDKIKWILGKCELE